MFNVERNFSVDRRFVASISFLLYGARLKDESEPCKKMAEALEFSDYRSMVHTISKEEGAAETIDEIFKTYPWDLAIEVAAAKMLRQYGGIANISHRVEQTNKDAAIKGASILHKFNQLEDRLSNLAERAGAGDADAPKPAQEPDEGNDPVANEIREKIMGALREHGIDPARADVKVVNMSELLRG